MRLIALLLLIPATALARAPEQRTRVLLAPTTLRPDTLQMKGFTPNRTPGQPALPERTVAIALHPHADLGSVTLQLRTGPTDLIPLKAPPPANPPHLVLSRTSQFRSWGRATAVLAGRDLAAYGQDARQVFPARVVQRGRITNRRGLLVLHLRYTPLRYRHGTRELLLDRHTEVLVRYHLRAAPPVRPDAALLPHLGRMINPAQARRWYRASQADTKAPVGYAIFIRDVLRQASKALPAFIAHKESLGMSVHVVTDLDLAKVAVGPEGGDAERIRGWLQQRYKELGLRYALLIGNPDPRRHGMPMKMTYAMIRHLKYKLTPPTDYYYAELTGNWDLDGDGYAAEYPDDDGPGGVEFTPELLVGRIPVYDDNVAALDQILEKSVRYATDKGDRSWRKRVLQPAAMLFFKNQYNEPHVRMDGADMANTIFTDVIEPRGLSRYTLFEQFGVDVSKYPSDAALSRDNVIAEWTKGYGLVTWFGHGSPEGAYRTVWTNDNGDGVPSYKEVSSPAFFSYDDTVALDDSRPAFVFHGSCSNGSPESATNVGYGLLRHGAIGTVSSSREALVVFETGDIDVSSANIFGVERDFTIGLLDNKTAGEALFWAKEKVSEKLGMVSWLTKLQLNLYGDPSLSLTTCASDTDCDDGNACNGVERCDAGQCAAGTAVDCGSDDPCQDASCDPATGSCTKGPRPDGEACDDGLFCTVNDTCAAGVCSGSPRCAAPGNPCVEAQCDEQARTCDLFAQPEGQPCHQGTGRQGSCSAGVCQPESSGCSLAATGSASASWPQALLLLLALGALRRRRR